MGDTNDRSLIDRNRLAELVKTAQESKDCSSDELGNILFDLCMKVINKPPDDKGLTFSGYSQEWKAEMIGNAMVAIFDAIMAHAMADDKSKLFNYLYKITLNSFTRTLKKLQAEYVESCTFNESVHGGGAFEAFHLRAKRRMLRGLLQRNKETIIELSVSRKLPQLRKVISKAVDEFTSALSAKQVKKLLDMAKKNREAAC